MTGKINVNRGLPAVQARTAVSMATPPLRRSGSASPSAATLPSNATTTRLWGRPQRPTFSRQGRPFYCVCVYRADWTACALLDAQTQHVLPRLQITFHGRLDLMRKRICESVAWLSRKEDLASGSKLGVCCSCSRNTPHLG